MLTEDIIVTMEGALLQQGETHAFKRCFLFSELKFRPYTTSYVNKSWLQTAWRLPLCLVALRNTGRSWHGKSPFVKTLCEIKLSDSLATCALPPLLAL